METGQPIVLTMNGMSDLVVQDLRSYYKLLEIAKKAEKLESLRVPIEERKTGKGRLVEEMRAAMTQILAEAKDRRATFRSWCP